MSNRVAIPEPYANIGALYASVQALREAVETLNGQRRSTLDAAVTWKDLIDLGLITPDQAPQVVGRDQAR